MLFIIIIRKMKYNKLKLINLIGISQKHRKETYDEVAKGVELSANMVGMINTGKSMPSVDSLARFARYYKKDINYFFDFDEDEIQTNIAAAPTPDYIKPGDSPYKVLFELQKEITEVIKENAELKVENERLKNAGAPVQNANVG